MDLELLRKIRLERGVKQKDIGDALHFKSKSGYCSLETGVRPIRLDQAIIVANCLSMNGKEFLTVFCPELNSQNKNTIRSGREK